MLVVAVGLLAVAAAGCGRTGASVTRVARSVDFGRFAGYTQIGPVVRSVSATITVPVVSSRANTALASTWVAAEAVGPDGQGEPFIQVGVNAIAGEPAPSAHLPTIYKAFWTDTDQGDHPSLLFAVHAGDRVSASLKLSQGRWIVWISDGSVHRRIVTAEEGNATFQQAAWLQEDSDKGLRLLAYPTVTGVRLSNVSVNGHAPAQQYLDPCWMSVGNILFEPSRLDHNGFTLQHREATGVGADARRLLTFAYGDDRLSVLQFRLAEATRATLGPKVGGWAVQTSKALISFARTLRRGRWSRNAHASVDRLLSALAGQLSLTHIAAHLSASQLAGWEARWSASAATMLIADARLLHALRLPE